MLTRYALKAPLRFKKWQFSSPTSSGMACASHAAT